MSKYYTCRYVVKPEEKDLAKRLCLAFTVDGLHCAAHVEQAKRDAEAAKAREEAFFNRPIVRSVPQNETFKTRDRWPIWP